MPAVGHPNSVVILAAGAGTRIGARDSGVPKPLVTVLGRPLLNRTLQSATDAGLERAVVVTGYHADQVEAAMRSHGTPRGLAVDVVRSRHWYRGNGASLLAAEGAVTGRFLVTMADHLVPASFLRLLAGAAPGTAGCLLVDEALDRVHDLNEATRVRRDGARIVGIGKHLTAFDAVDTGVFSFDSRIFEALRTLEARGGDLQLSDAVQLLADRGQMRAEPADGSFWCDVDTPEDLAFARRHLEREMQRAVVSSGRQAVASP